MIIRSKVLFSGLIFVATICSASQAGVWQIDSYLAIHDGDVYDGEIFAISNATIDVFGGTVSKLETQNSSTANVYKGKIDWLFTDNNSVTNIRGADFKWIGSWDNSKINLHAYDVSYHQSGGLENRSWVSGTYYKDNRPFDFTLYSDAAYQHIHVVPEPTTLLLCGIGGLLFLRKKKNEPLGIA